MRKLGGCFSDAFCGLTDQGTDAFAASTSLGQRKGPKREWLVWGSNTGRGLESQGVGFKPSPIPELHCGPGLHCPFSTVLSSSCGKRTDVVSLSV